MKPPQGRLCPYQKGENCVSPTGDHAGICEENYPHNCYLSGKETKKDGCP